MLDIIYLPAADKWLSSLPKAAKIRIIDDIETLAEYGLPFAGNYISISKADPKENVLYIRTRHNKEAYRTFFAIENGVIILHGIDKKTQKLPPNEIKTAVHRLKDFKARK